MKIYQNIQEAFRNKEELHFHVVSENEVHSFDNMNDAFDDLEDAQRALTKIGSDFVPELIQSF